MSDNNIRLQNLRDFTVQIRNANDEIVGTGIAVSTDGKIVTCAHVVRAAGIEPRDANSAEVGLYFPQAREGEEKKLRATVVKYFLQHDDDIVLLQTTIGSLPLAPEQIALLGTADRSEGNPFRTYGYSPIGNYPATRGDGVILGSIEPPPGSNLQVDPIQLQSRGIAEGMSGAAVLDVNRNLVVGLIIERYFPQNSVQDDIGFGVDSKALTIDPFDFALRGQALELRAAPKPKLEKDLFIEAAEFARLALEERSGAEIHSWNNAPAPLTEWTGRDDLLKQITADWNDLKNHVTGLIGFGGEGKSSLARKWVDSVIAGEARQSPALDGIIHSTERHPAGVFWWGFYENRSVDEFLEAALNYMSGGKLDSRQIQSSSLRAQLIGAMLAAGRYLFVLDGLEVMQHQDGDQYGLLQSHDLHDLLSYFARPDNQSFCLVTSRVPLLDLMDYTTYNHRDVDRLTSIDGRTLLKRLGVRGTNTQLDRAVANWDGHALTLSLIGAYLVEYWAGDVFQLSKIPTPTAHEPRYERVHRVLRRYDEHVTQAGREFLKIFSAFRTPVYTDAFEKVFLPLLSDFVSSAGALGADEAGANISALASRLTAYRILRHEATTNTYTTHPLIRNHYLTLLANEKATRQHKVHHKIRDYYLSRASEMPEFPTLDDLKPLIEGVYHACLAGNLNDAFNIYAKIEQPPYLYPPNGRSILMFELGAYDTCVELLTNFFRNSDFSTDPRVKDPLAKSVIVTDLGLAMGPLGRLSAAELLHRRALKADLRIQKWANVSSDYEDLAEINLFLGQISVAKLNAQSALEYAKRANDEEEEWTSYAYQARAAYLAGDLKSADELFELSSKVHQHVYPDMKFLHDLWGTWYVDYLRRTNRVRLAYKVARKNLKYSKTEHQAEVVSQCHRALGDLDADTGDHDSAITNYGFALKIARSISIRDVLIEALLTHGRLMAKYVPTAGSLNPGEADLESTITDAFNELNEALNYTMESGYRIYEADTRVALGWVYLAGGERQKAKESVERALQLSREIGYYWGHVDALEVLEKIRTIQ